MIKEFKEFISKGNIVDLAVAVIIGAAFGLIVKSFTDDILGQFIAALGGTPDFKDFGITIRTVTNAAGQPQEIKLRIGLLINAIVNFLIVAFTLFLVVKGINKAQAAKAKDVAEEDEEPTEAELLAEIRDLLKGQAGR